MTIPKYVIELMRRAEYNYTQNSGKGYEVGYTIDIAKYSYYEYVETFKSEIERLKKWVERQSGGECIIINVPTKTSHKHMQYATVTIFDPVMQHIEQYIGKRTEKPLDLCDLMCN